MGLSFFKILLIVIVVFIVFGAGKLPKVMADLGKGLKSFKDALNDNPPNEIPKSETPPTKIEDNNKSA